MTSTTDAPSRTSRNMLLAVLGVVASIAATAVGTFADLSDNESGSDESFAAYLGLVGFIVIAAAVVFGLVVRNAAEGNPGRRAAILGAVGAVSVLVFWSGLPLVLAAGSVACALIERDKVGSFGAGSKAGLALSALAAVGAALLAVVG